MQQLQAQALRHSLTLMISQATVLSQLTLTRAQTVTVLRVPAATSN